MTTAEWTPELKLWLQQQAVAAGFNTAGIAPVSVTNSSAQPPLDAERFAAWVAAGRAGEMDYLKRRDHQGVLLRSDVQVAIPWARSVIVCALDYSAPGPLSIHNAPPGAGWIARYAWSGRTPDTESETKPDPAPDKALTDKYTADLLPTDYHDQLLHRLRQIEHALHDRLPCETRCYVDTGPLVERAAAAKAGIGWIGKNTCVLNQQLGSWLLLAVIVTSIPISSIPAAPEAQSPLTADRCGSCTRCIDACPTAALVAPHEMDASRCIAYLTIEKKGAIPEEFREPIGRQIFGCDICQDVCPWNTKAQNTKAQNPKIQNRQTPTPPSANHDMLPRPQLINPPLEWLAAMDAPQFKRWFKGSPLERTGRKRLHRNIAIAMGNSGEQKFTPQLKTWAEAGDPILAEAANWATTRIRTLEAQRNQPPIGEPKEAQASSKADPKALLASE